MGRTSTTTAADLRNYPLPIRGATRQSPETDTVLL
jgi:hypothetical protein